MKLLSFTNVEGILSMKWKIDDNWTALYGGEQVMKNENFVDSRRYQTR